VFEATRGNREQVERGGYVLTETNDTPELLLIATGSEVSLAVDAKAELEKTGVSVRVVAMPSRELFDRQSAEYRQSVLPDAVGKRITIEAGISLGWEKYAGTAGAVLSIDTFGASGPGGAVMEAFGFSVDHVVRVAKSL
jgi:transketolase